MFFRIQNQTTGLFGVVVGGTGDVIVFNTLLAIGLFIFPICCANATMALWVAAVNAALNTGLIAVPNLLKLFPNELAILFMRCCKPEKKPAIIITPFYEQLYYIEINKT
jgi:hypothetical protein